MEQTKTASQPPPKSDIAATGVPSGESAPKSLGRFQHVEECLRELVARESIPHWQAKTLGQRGWSQNEQEKARPAIGWEVVPGAYMVYVVGAREEVEAQTEALCEAVKSLVERTVPGSTVALTCRFISDYKRDDALFGRYLRVTLPSN